MQKDTYEVKQIIDKKQMKNELYYLVWYKNELRKDASWQKGTDLIEDGMDDFIDDYKKEANKKKKKK